MEQTWRAALLPYSEAEAPAVPLQCVVQMGHALRRAAQTGHALRRVAPTGRAALLPYPKATTPAALPRLWKQTRSAPLSITARAAVSKSAQMATREVLLPIAACSLLLPIAGR